MGCRFLEPTMGEFIKDRLADSPDFVGGQAARTCAAADRTGHAFLHALYQGNLKNNTEFLMSGMR